VALLGLTFKPNTDDIREAPAIYIAQEILTRGGRLRAYDPVGMENASHVLNGNVTFCSDAYDAATGSDALVIATEWNQFRNLDMDRMKELLARPILVDLKNIYDPERIRDKGFAYYGVGRN
jgi:UDPglucose 6-dehydrogenase